MYLLQQSAFTQKNNTVKTYSCITHAINIIFSQINHKIKNII